jgi:hypothetical protein
MISDIDYTDPVWRCRQHGFELLDHYIDTSESYSMKCICCGWGNNGK